MAVSSALLSPPQRDLQSLFEASRLLGRHVELSDALEALLGLLAGTGRFGPGLAAASRSGAEGPRFLAATAPEARPLIGKTVGLGDEGAYPRSLPAEILALARACGQSLERAEALLDAEGRICAPALSGGRVCALLAFLPAEAAGRDELRAALGLAEAVATLYAEAFSLRARIAEETRRATLTGLLPPESAAPRAEPAPAHSARGPAGPEDPLAAMAGSSPAMQSLRGLLARAAPTESTVLLMGESGTGKELAARAIHGLSMRAGGPFVAVNCAALPESLIESELFGHERGAFTGAHERRIGRFELAAGGTLFFDEIGELGALLQAKLLRVLQERSFERVGGGRPVKADVRVVAATNRDLEAEVAAGRFRADLWYRLNVVSVRLPPLRERGADIVLLADRFARAQGGRGRPVLRISTPALDLLTSYHWPGNVRELQNAIESAAVLSQDGVIHAYHLPPSLQSAQSTGTGPATTLDAALARLERELLVEALKMQKGNAAAAARELGLTERRMGLALRKYGLDWRRFRP